MMQRPMHGRRKAVGLSPSALVKVSHFNEEGDLPLVIQPAVSDVDLESWTRANRDFIETKLSSAGAILFRDFKVRSASEFERCAGALGHELFPGYGDLPQAEAGSPIYRSTPYPPDQVILFHNEASHTHRWPMKQWFFCVRPSEQGGETPLLDCRKVYSLLDPALVEQFENKQLMYVRNFTEGLDVSWQQFFKTADKSTVERYCTDASINFEWKNNGLRTRQVCAAVASHPKTGEKVFFNQIQLHHLSCNEPDLRDAMLAVFGMENLPRQVYYGDGSPIEESVMREINQLYQRIAVNFQWQEGDVLLLDNMLTAHARNRYTGSRKILVAMAEMIGCERV
jgi:alpha-ketoglutarate-dependent taurine dioxygenase